MSGQLARFETMESDEGEVPTSGETKSSDLTPSSAPVGIDHRLIPTVVSLVPRPMRWDYLGLRLGVAVRKEVGEETLSERKIVDVSCGDHHTGKRG